MYRSMICTLAALVANIIIAAPISFEQQDATLKWSVTGDGQVQVTTAKSKDGERSLAWEWHDGGSLTFTDAEVLKEAGGFSTWIYTSRPMDQTLRVRFGPTGSTIAENVPYAFDYPLSFRGWRYCTVGFDEDIPVEDFAGDSTVTEMTIEAPAGTSGRVMFDLMEFPPHVLWSRGADRQLPFINPRREYDWFIHFDDRAQEAAPTHPAAGAEIEDIERIERRYHSWLTGAGADWSDPLVRSRLDEFLQKAQEAKDRLEDLTNRPLVKLGDFRTVFGDLGILAVACNTDAPDNPFYDADDIREMILAAFRHVHEQGFAEGSLFGDARVFRLMTGGYEAAVFLMRDELAAAGMLQTQLNAMRWYSCIGRVFVETDNRGMNADVIRGRYLMCLAYVLSLPDANRQAMWMRHLSPWMSRGLLPAPETSDTIKPDYTGFHHAMIVGNSYVINALHAGSTTQYLLDDTTFSLSPTATDSLRKALLAARWYANKYDVPTMLALRWPFITGSLYQLIPAYAYQALTDADGQMAGVFARLWDPSVSEMAEKSLGMGPIGFCYMGTMGAVEAVQKAAERAVPAEPNPEGFRFFPYGALAVHRRGDWMVATKGWSKYIKNYEQQQYRDGCSGRNIHGRYTSHGTTEIYSAGEPVSPGASGYVEDGWDWNRWPGSTAIYLPWDELYEKGPYGRQVNEETFVGAVEHNGKSGMFAMQLSDPHHAPGFFARKSYLYVDDMIVCLGSNIASDDTQHPVETTIFQLGLPDTGAPTHISSAGPITQFPMDWTAEADEPLWLIDHVGHGYWIPQSRGLHLRRHVQKTPWHGVPEPKTTGEFAVAWIDHGKAPQGEGYEYAILVQTSPGRMQAFADDPGYEVLQKDSRAHVVRHTASGLTGHALFSRGEVATGTIVSEVNRPCLVMTRQSEGRCALSVADPDLRWEQEAPDGAEVVVTLKGRWTLTDTVSNAGSRAEARFEGNTTLITAPVGDGRTTELSLVEAQ